MTDIPVDIEAAHLADCDSPRRNDLDGRGHPSEEALARFTRFFLEVCLDQVAFMEGLVQPDRLRARILLWADEETRVAALPAKAGDILNAVLYRDEVPRGEVGNLLGATDRHARRVVAALVERRRRTYRLADRALLIGAFTPALQRALRLVPDPQGPVTLLRAFGTRWAWRAIDGLTVAHPWLICGELLCQADPRGLEAAEHLRQNYLTGV